MVPNTWIYSANRGLLTKKEYNDNKGPAYTYTPGGRLLTRTWARLDGVSALTTTYDYDNAGQLIEIDYSDTTTDVTHTYNRRGQIAQTVDAAGTRVYTYNSAGQMLTEGYTAGIMEDLGITNV